MQTKTVEEALKLQAEFNARLAQNMDVLRKGKTMTTEAAVKEKRRQVSAAKARIESLESERSKAVDRLDQQVEQGKAEFSRLERELSELEAKLQGTGGIRRGSPQDALYEGPSGKSKPDKKGSGKSSKEKKKDKKRS